MKKNDQDRNRIHPNISSKTYLETGKIKTTNVNILLNRVRLDRKRELKKRIVFSVILVSLISLLAIYFNI